MESPYIIELPKIIDRRGNLSFVEGLNHIPFEIKRTFWIYDVPGGEIRGGHAYKETEEFIVALSGSFDIVIHDGLNEKRIHLNRSYFGVYIPKMMWRFMDNFSTNSVALVLSSTHFSEQDYIRDFNIFANLVKNKVVIENFSSSFVSKSIEIKEHESNTNKVFNCSFLEFDKHSHDKGNITVVENSIDIPFDVKRSYYLYDIPGGEDRGGHAHKELYQLVIAAGGAFDVTLDDGNVKRTITLNRPYQGLFIVPGLWRELHNFSSGAICLVLASHVYNENDYIRSYDEFLKYKLWEKA